jgi:sec-independent protein translocase protein TatC
MSSALDDDTMSAIRTGRETAWDVLGSAKRHLQKAFILFVVGLFGAIVALRVYVWDFLQQNTRSQMNEVVGSQVDIITRNPFDVILVQFKIGLFVGILLTLPLLFYYSRGTLRERGFTSVVPISRGQQVLFGLMSVLLFAGGVFYAFSVFFPVMFDFLATNAIKAAVKPSYDIVMYVQFLLLLTVSFGFAAQLPLFMSVLSYTEIVAYETFRDKWKYAVIAIFAFGAMFSPPDPFTQIMWAAPLCALYVFSLGLAKLVTNIRRAGESGGMTVRGGLVRLAALFSAVAVGAYAAAVGGGLEYFNANLRPEIPELVRPGPLTVEGVVGTGGTFGTVMFALTVALVLVLVVLFVFVVRVLNQPVVPKGGFTEGADELSELNVEVLGAEQVRGMSAEMFAGMDEDEVVGYAGTAMENDDPEKAQAILDKFDEAQERAEEAEGEGAESGEAGDGETEDDGGLFAGTAAGMADAFTEEETTEEDIGGYFYDIQFILQSLTSKAFRIVGVFMVVLGVTFYWLYQGGLGTIKSSFFSQVSQETLRKAAGAVAPGTVETAGQATSSVLGSATGAALAAPPVGGDPAPSAANYIIALHPVEQLIFEVKVSTIVGAVVALPMVLYYAWPAIKQRWPSSAGGDRRVFLVWGLTLIGGMFVGSLVGFFFIAPWIISWFVSDALTASMVISYRLNSFMWLVIFTTLGIGILADVPLTMLLFDRGGIVSYATMRKRWRVVVLGAFVLAGLVIPGGTITMFVLAIPMCLAYAAGLALLWVVTLPRRLGGGGRGGAGDDEPTVVG